MQENVPKSAQQTENTALENRIAELEMKAMFQEQLLEELNFALGQQQQQLEKLQRQLKLMVDKLYAVQPSQIALQSEETPPPHY